MKKYKILLLLTFMLVFAVNLFGQDPTAPDLPGDAQAGDVPLDGVPIAGQIYFVLAALGVGAFILFRKQKTERNYKE